MSEEFQEHDRNSPMIKDIEYGLGFTCEDNGITWIEINKNLKKYPHLYNYVLQHELQHYYNGKSRFDFGIELKSYFTIKNEFELLKFSFKYPKAFASFLPFMKTKTGFAWNSYMCVFWSVLIVSFTLGIGVITA